MITEKQLEVILSPIRHDRYKMIEIVNDLNVVYNRYEINTPLRICHFLAQVLHESGGFVYNRELWGPTKAQRGYEGRKDLGNTEPGDGFRYRGRGYIQLTGRENYRIAGRDLQQNFIDNPDLVAESPWNMIVAGWFWNLRNLIEYSDKDSIRDVTVRVNGGLNGLKDRQKWLDKCKSIIL